MLKSYLWILVLCLFLFSVPAEAQTSACDLNGDGTVNVVDVQLATNMDLGVTPCTANVAGQGVCTPQVVQTIINTALGGTCSLHYVAVNWSASTSPSIAGYNVYRSSTSGGTYTKLNSALIAGTNFTDTTVQAGQIYYYVATAVNTSSAESAYSTEISAMIPTP